MSEEELALTSKLAHEPWNLVVYDTYADWLEKQGRYEESQTIKSKRESAEWFLESAKDFSGEFRSYDIENSLHDTFVSLLTLLKAHKDTEDADLFGNAAPIMSFTGVTIGDWFYSDEMWKHFHNLTGHPAPQGDYRYTTPYLRCSC